jgi:predicted transcriptional regulator
MIRHTVLMPLGREWLRSASRVERVTMSKALTVTLPESVSQALDDFARREGLAADTVVEQAITEHIFLKQLRSLRERMQAKARALGVVTDDDVFDQVS